MMYSRAERGTAKVMVELDYESAIADITVGINQVDNLQHNLYFQGSPECDYALDRKAEFLFFRSRCYQQLGKHEQSSLDRNAAEQISPGITDDLEQVIPPFSRQ